MAETPLSSIAKKILGKLNSPLLQEIALAREVKEELRELGNTLSSFMPVLLDAEMVETENYVFAEWLKRLHDVLDEADNLLEGLFSEFLRSEVMTKNNAAKMVRIFFSRLCLLAFSRKMGKRVKGIRESLDRLKGDRMTINLHEQHEERRRKETRPFVPVIVNDVVGREKDKNAILALLLESHKKDNVSIIPIVGIGGIGKTTLAKLVYNDEQVDKHFELRMWVCVSDVYDVKGISRDIIESATKKNCELLEKEQVVYELIKAIDGRKYLLVLDDVWNEDTNKWQELKAVLMCGARGSKILVTTRTKLVAELTGTISPFHLKDLSESESWSLFNQMAFRHGDLPENPNLVKIGKEILKKCVGVPLAIRTVGALLYTREIQDWLYVKDKELSEIDQTESGIFPILKLSYDYLPPHLKRCFACCSLFPRGNWIDKQRLIQSWIAEGFIQLSHERQHLEDVGEKYFMELLRRSFFNDVQEDLEGNIISCKMHVLIHTLAQWITNANDIIGSSTHHHLSVSNHIDLPNKLRTFLLATQEKESEHVILSNEDITGFKSVQVLDLHKSGIKMVPSFIGQLTRLTYLDLSENWFSFLPECVCMLQNLQTLKLNGCRYLKELPKGTRRLVSLQHLEIQGCSLSHMPQGLGQLTSLQTLGRFVVGRRDKSTVGFSGGLSELQGLVNLRGTLCIERLRGSINIETWKKGCCLAGLEFLESLSLFWDSVEIDYPYRDHSLLGNLVPHRNLKKLLIHGYGGMGLPSWMTFQIDLHLPKLVEIELSGCCRCQNLTKLGLLPCLEILRLSAMESLEYIYEEDRCTTGDSQSSGSVFTFTLKAPELFQSLKKLHLYYLAQLKGLGRRWGRTYSFGGTRHLAVLQELRISSCPRLDLYADDGKERIDMGLRSLTFLSVTAMPQLASLPLWLQSLTNLQPIEIQRCENLIIPEWTGDLGSLPKLQIHADLEGHGCNEENRS